MLGGHVDVAELPLQGRGGVDRCSAGQRIHRIDDGRRLGNGVVDGEAHVAAELDWHGLAGQGQGPGLVEGAVEEGAGGAQSGLGAGDLDLGVRAFRQRRARAPPALFAGHAGGFRQCGARDPQRHGANPLRQRREGREPEQRALRQAGAQDARGVARLHEHVLDLEGRAAGTAQA